MIPSTSKILQCMAYTFENALMPVIEGDYQKSLCLTMCNFFRYAKELVENEGRLMYEDNQQLQALLPKVAGYFASLPQSQEVNRILDRLRRDADIQDGFMDTNRLNAISLELKEKLDAALKLLVSFPAEQKATPAYREIRQAIRSYLTDNFNREEELIRASFTTKRR